jgi:putative endonuclease
MKDAKTLVFIEVRLRTNSQFGNAGASITNQKQHKLILTAQHYLQLHGDCQCRFDAVLMSKADIQHIEWIRNAISL